MFDAPAIADRADHPIGPIGPIGEIVALVIDQLQLYFGADGELFRTFECERHGASFLQEQHNDKYMPRREGQRLYFIFVFSNMKMVSSQAICGEEKG